MPVRFLRSYSPYQANEVAGFSSDREAELIRLGVAEPYPPVEARPNGETVPEKPLTPLWEGLNAADAIDRIKAMDEKDILELWLAAEERKTVRRALEERLAELGGSAGV